jgi:hypothetical protein
VDMRDDRSVGQRHVLCEKLLAEIRAEVDQDRLVGAFIFHMHRKPTAFNTALAGETAGVTVTANSRRARRIAGSKQGDTKTHWDSYCGGVSASSASTGWSSVL